MYFAIRQYVDNYEKYCRELDSAERIEFYEKAHSVFNSEIFDGLTEKGLNDDKLFRKYSIIKKHDSSELKKLKTEKDNSVAHVLSRQNCGHSTDA